MNKTNPKKRLLAFLDGSAQREALLPLLSTLARRSRIEVRALTRIKASAYNLEATLEIRRRGLRPKLHLGRITTRSLRSELESADAALVISDALLDLSKNPERSHAVRELDVPTVFVQHGAIQSGVNTLHPSGQSDYHSQLLLLWELGSHENSTIAPAALKRAAPVGFTKDIRPPRQRPTAALRQWAGQHQTRILFCLPPVTEYQVMDQSVTTGVFTTLEGILERWKGVGIIARTHRNQSVPAYEKRLEKLASKYPAAILGPPQRKGTEISLELSLALCSITLAPPSTILLDSAYQGLGVGLLQDGGSIFPEVPLINSLEAIAARGANCADFFDASAQLRKRYGDHHANIERAAALVEQSIQ